eukprot:IDg6886t1
MFIGSAWKPRAFKKKTGKELGFDYHANKKSWMTQVLFYDWLRRFDAYICESPERKVALLIDNCSAHGTQESLPTLQAVTVIFLPPNTTSKTQPMDAGVIASIKVRYRTAQMERAVDLIDEDSGTSDVYKVDVLTAMKTLTRVWETIPSHIISNCWEHIKLSPATQCIPGVTPLSDSLEKECDALQAQISSLVLSRSRMTIENFINDDDEEDCVEAFDEEEALFGSPEDPLLPTAIQPTVSC